MVEAWEYSMDGGSVWCSTDYATVLYLRQFRGGDPLYRDRAKSNVSQVGAASITFSTGEPETPGPDLGVLPGGKR
jgi:hypothetical protein